MSKSRGLKNTSGVYPGRLNQADFNEMIHTVGTLPLRRDFVTLLAYVRESKVVGTQSTGNMQLKSVREVTARFVEPPVLDTEIGDRVYRLRSEEDVWPLYFLHILAEVGGLLKTPRAKEWRLTRMGVNFLDLNEMQQVAYLLNVWWYQVNWLVAYPVQGLGDSLPINFQSITLSRLDALPVGKAVKCFRDVIEQGDVLPQPWGNIGICLLMQQRYDEAEHALKRVLEIDPDYKLAQVNLAKVEKARSGEITPRVAMSDPFENTKKSVDFLHE